MFGIGVPELVVILVVALIFLGPSRLPEVAKALGRALGEFRKATSDISVELRDVRRTLEKEVREAERDSARKKAKAAATRPDEPKETQARGEEASES
jgi:TatA/E family protein of Tat protein translocase